MSLSLLTRLSNGFILSVATRGSICKSAQLTSQFASQTPKNKSEKGSTFDNYFTTRRAVRVLESISDVCQLESAEKGDIEIYTDGSTVKFGSGCAFAVTTPDHQTEQMFKTNTAATNNQLELLAIEKALIYVSKLKLNTDGPLKVIVNTDSQVSIYRVTNENNANPCARRVRKEIEKLRRRNISVAMRFIKAHAGIPGNELANSLAHRAVEEGTMVDLSD